MWKRALVLNVLVGVVLLAAAGAFAAVGAAPSTTSSTTSSSVTSTSPSTTSPSTTTTPTAAPSAGPGVTYAVADAGTVVVDRVGDTLAVGAVTPNAGWAAEVEQAAGREVEVKFVTTGLRADFTAEIEDGVVKVRVRTRAIDGDEDATSVSGSTTTTSTTVGPAPATADTVEVVDLGPAGSITVAVEGGVISLRSVDIAAEWERTELRASSTEIEIELRNGDVEVEAEVELEHGRLDIEVEIRADEDHHADGRGDDADDD